MTSFQDVRAKAKRRVRSVDVCVDQSLAEQHDQLSAELREADKGPQATMADGGTARALAEQLQELEATMAAQRVRFHIQALSQRAFHALLDDHPPRVDEDDKPNPRDAQHGFDWSTFPQAIIAATSIDPPEGQDGCDKLTEEQAAELFHELLSAADAEELLNAALRDNVIASRIPFSVLASATLQEPEPS